MKKIFLGVIQMNKKVFFLSLCSLFLFFSCSTKYQKENIEKIINDGQFAKAERILKSDIYTKDEKEYYFNLIFDKKVKISVDKLYEGDWKYLTKMIKKNFFTQEQFDKILSSVYIWIPNIQTIMEKTGYLIPVNSFCGNYTVLETAVKEQNYEFIEELIKRGADLQLIDKSGQFNPLSFSIECKGDLSTAIFKLLLDNTPISSENFKPDKYGNTWYVEKLSHYGQWEMMKLFFENKEALNAFFNTNDCLKQICNLPVIFDFCDENSFLNINNIDLQFDYFESALESCNPKAVKMLMKLNVSPIVKSRDKVEIFFMSAYKTNDGIAWSGLSTDRYQELLELKPELDEYIKKW
mgnify:FL=1